MTLDLLDQINELPGPEELRFVCPAGLSLLTYDERYFGQLMERLMRAFSKGHRLYVVLRTDFKMSEVSNISGPWLVAHLLGYIQSFYYDDFHKTESVNMIASAGDKFSLQIFPDAKTELRVKAVPFDGDTALIPKTSFSQLSFHGSVLTLP